MLDAIQWIQLKKGNKNDDFTDDEAHRLEDEIQKNHRCIN